MAARLGYAATYAVPLITDGGTRLGAAVWLYDEPGEPTARQRELVGSYLRYAAEHSARLGELARNRAAMATLQEELLPSALPRVPGVTLAARHRTGPGGGGDWYDALPLPERALGLSVGGVTGGGPAAVAAMGRLRASLRAYAVMEGEDPVAVLSDLELLLRLTEPSCSATALFAYVEPASRKVLLAGAGHCPPLIVGPHRIEPVETAVSAPLGMLACWEAPSAEVVLREGETLLCYTDGLLHRTGDSMDRAFARLRSAAASAPAPRTRIRTCSSNMCCARCCQAGLPSRVITPRTSSCWRPASENGLTRACSWAAATRSWIAPSPFPGRSGSPVPHGAPSRAP